MLFHAAYLVHGIPPSQGSSLALAQVAQFILMFANATLQPTRTMKRLTKALLMIFADSSLGGCSLFASDANAEPPELTAEAGTDTDVGE